ncbi:MAG: hypothetical protein ACTSYA_02660 [Candidatus Kariarchaeaceae archaeon]
MEEEKTFFYSDEEIDPSDGYQRHSQKSRRRRSKPERDEERYSKSKTSHSRPRRKKERVRKDWS